MILRARMFRTPAGMSTIMLLGIVLVVLAPARSAAQNPATPPAAAVSADTIEFHVRTKYSPAAIASSGSGQSSATLQSAAPGASTASAAASAAASSASSSALPNDSEWSATLVRSTRPGNPIDVQLSGSNVVAALRFVPLVKSPGEYTVIIQGQVKVRRQNGTESLFSTVNTMIVPLGGTILFYPLGINKNNEAPITVEIKIDSASK